VVSNFAKGGTGYLKEFKSGGAPACGTDACPNYLEMIPAVAAARPDVVIVAGGRNDGKLYTQALAANVASVYAELRKALPDAKIIGLSPIWAADNPEPDISQYKAGVQAAVESVGGTYVDLGEPFAGHPEMITSDGVHPNTLGHKHLADVVDGLLPGGL
jgi:lysophospholipase L1-like esterase